MRAYDFCEGAVVSRRWGLTWALALLLAACFFAGWELFWRSHGFTPSLTDDAALWASARRGLTTETVLIGGSRMQLGVDPEVWERATGKRPVQLAINGSRTFPIFEHISRDESFRGTLVVDLAEDEVGLVAKKSKPYEYVEHYEGQTLSDRAEFQLLKLIKGSTVSTLPELAPHNILRQGELPPRPYTRLREDRFTAADYTLTDISKRRENQLKQVAGMWSKRKPLSEGEFRRELDAWAEAAERIRARGGRVVFVRMPTSGPLWEAEEKVYPKASYWDAVVAKRFEAVHFKELGEFECPDYSHLDVRDTGRFTEALARKVSM